MKIQKKGDLSGVVEHDELAWQEVGGKATHAGHQAEVYPDLRTSRLVPPRRQCEDTAAEIDKQNAKAEACSDRAARHAGSRALLLDR